MEEDWQNVNSASDPPPEGYIKRFWKLLTFKRLPTSTDEINALVQVEMMKHFVRAPICKVHGNQIEKYVTRLFVKETNYFCNRSKLLVKSQAIRNVIDLLTEQDLKWHIEVNVEGNAYLFATWSHWNMT